MSSMRVLSALTVGLLALVPAAVAQPPAGVSAAIEKGVAFLRNSYGGAVALPGPGPLETASGNAGGLGARALAGLALLEGGVPPTDPAVQNIAQAVRAGILADPATYHIALAVMFLDKLKVPGDVPLIQVLGVRLYAGMNASGGWDYSCLLGVPPQVVAALIADAQNNQMTGRPAEGKERPQTPKGADGFPTVQGGGKAEDAEKSIAGLHPAAAAYYRLARGAGRAAAAGDNSNTQFGLIGLWVAARNGVPADDAFAVIERRFLGTQNRTTFGWSYNGDGSSETTPSMTCAGLLGLAVGAARGSGSQIVPKTQSAPAGGNPNDPFANPPKPTTPAPKGNEPLPADRRQAAVVGALRYLQATVFSRPAAGRNSGQGIPGSESRHYLLWSIERVAVAYGLPTIGGVDWYEWGCSYLIPAQQADGSWQGNYSREVDTSFAILFLTKSNVVADLTSKIGGTPLNTELRAGRGKQLLTPPPGAASREGPLPAPGGTPAGPAGPAKTPADEVADALVAATGEAFTLKLRETRDAKGGDNTTGLLKAIGRLDAGRQNDARDALADRLTRMTTATLRGMLRNEDAELRRAVCLAVAMKDDKGFIPDLVERITDPADLVVRAARAGLRSLTGQDHGPAPNADDAAKRKAQADWRAATAKK